MHLHNFSVTEINLSITFIFSDTLYILYLYRSCSYFNVKAQASMFYNCATYIHCDQTNDKMVVNDCQTAYQNLYFIFVMDIH